MSNKFIDNKRVAIVGNAISLLELDYAKEIDDHEVVIRINNTAVYHTDASGTKIDIWAFNDKINYEDRLNPANRKQRDFYFDYKNRNGITLDLSLSNRRHHGVFWNEDWLIPGVDLNKHSVQLKKDIIKRFTDPSCGVVLVSIIGSYNPISVSLYGFDWKRTPTFQAEANHRYIVKQEDKDGNIIHRYDSQHRHNYDSEEEYIRNHFLTRDNWKLCW